ncbi:MAG: beta strand repeat-containing protein, partial [Planctomycetia bacterium]
GGSRRRNVPDQMEQPMMRNEHIVRAHQTPKVALNPSTGTPWNVIHVNNAAAGAGDGTAQRPFTTVAAANAAAINPYDIVLVDPGTGAAYDAAVGLNTTFSPLAANQYFIGDGAAFFIPTACCGPLNIGTTSGLRPVLTNPTGASINLTNGLVVNNFDIVGSQVGILGTGNLSSGIPRPGFPPYDSAVGASVVNNVAITGTQLAGQTGVLLDNATGDAAFQNTVITNMTKAGFAVNGGDPNVDFSGTIQNDVATNGGFVSPVVDIVGTTGGEINLAVGTAPAGSTIPNKIVDNGGAGIKIADNTGGTINVGNATLTNTQATAIDVQNSLATINVTDTAIVKDTSGTAVNVNGGAPVFDYKGTITNQQGNMLHVNATTGGSVTLTSPAGSPFIDNGDGILVENSAGDVTVKGATINSQQEGILVQNSSGVNTFNDVTITGATTAGVSLQNNTGTDQFNNLNIQTTGATGFLANTAATVNVTGNSNVNTTGAAAISMKNVSAANVAFNTVSSTDSPGNGVLLDAVSGSVQATNVTIDTSAGSGFAVRNSTGLDLQVAKATIVTAAAPGANGIEVTNSTSPAGGAIEFKSVDVTTSQGTGVLVSNSDLVKIGTGTVDATGGAAINATSSKLEIVLAGASSTNSTSNGINLVGNSGSVAVAQTTITAPTGVGINVVDNVPGFIADFGVTSVSNPGTIGVNIVNAASPTPTIFTSFDSLNIATTNATGFRAINGGTINFNSPAAVTATGGPAVVIENTTGTTNSVSDSGFTFGDINSTNSTSNGILLRNLNSNFAVQGSTTIDGANSTAIQILDTQSPAGVYDVRFNTVTITNRQSAGLEVDGIGGQVIVQSLIIDNAAAAPGPAVSITNTSADGGRVYVNSGNISDSNGNGFFVQNAIASIQNTSIDSPFANGILVQSLAGETSTVSYSGGINTGAGNDGVLLQASGGGIINASVLQNSIDVTLNPVEAIVLDAPSQILLNAANNFGTGGGPPTVGSFVLNNLAGGVLGISQASTADMTITNSGVAVSTSGVITTSVPVPTPPPQSP